jgi:acid phosphatase (class A)
MFNFAGHSNLRSPAGAASRGIARRAAGACLWLFLAARLFAAETYLQPGHPNSVALLAPPPIAGSDEAAADLNTVRAVFKNRTPEEEERAKRHEDLSLFNFAEAVGPALAPGKLPKTEELYKKVKKELGVPINTAKDHWLRKRPYEIDPNLGHGEPEKSASYPSGHSTRGTVYALVLAEVFPDQKEDILRIGREIGWDRVLIGKHFPTDIYAGRVLAKAIVRELMESPDFQHDLAEAKAEAQAAMHPVPAGQGH